MLNQISHRDWPFPKSPWLMTQIWNDLLFSHWPVAVNDLKKLIPVPLQLDTFAGSAWVSIVPFLISNIRFRGLPSIPFTSNFYQLNVRTYVVYRERPGVYFFSLDCNHRLAVFGARTFFHLPYYHADIQVIKKKDFFEWISRRTHKNAPSAELRVTYRPVSPPTYSLKGTLDYWLTERFVHYTQHRNHLYRSEIYHRPWKLQQAEAEIDLNTLGKANQISIPNFKPIFHFSKQLQAQMWPLIKENS